MLVDMGLVEYASNDCVSLIPKIEEYNTEKGHYPKKHIEIESEINVDHCHYQLMEKGYIFVLGGSLLNLQAYVYDSNTKKWKWD